MKTSMFTPGEGAETVIYRYGQAPEAYISGLDLIEYVPELALAYVRAIKQGYLTK